MICRGMIGGDCMRKMLLILAMLCMVFFHAGLAAAVEALPEVFYSNLKYEGAPVDLAEPSPACAEGKCLYTEYLQKGHERCWMAYWYSSQAVLQWQDIYFSAVKKPPNYNDWVHWDCHCTAVWGDYFTEMFYEGGAENPLADETYDWLWAGLRLNGRAVDPFTAPPNYDDSLDCYAAQRGEIGYHWYWEYYISGLCWERSMDDILNPPAKEEPVLKWNGIAIDTSAEPENYCAEADPYYYNRMQRGYLLFWAQQIAAEGLVS